MREHKFRGKRIDNGEWVYGGIIVKDGYAAIVTYSDYHGWHEFIAVVSDTVGEYTGLKDKNGKEIWEGDILHRDAFWDMYTVWDEENARFAFLCTDWVVTQGHPIFPTIADYVVIGNIHDNADLFSEGALK